MIQVGFGCYQTPTDEVIGDVGDRVRSVQRAYGRSTIRSRREKVQQALGP